MIGTPQNPNLALMSRTLNGSATEPILRELSSNAATASPSRRATHSPTEPSGPRQIGSVINPFSNFLTLRTIAAWASAEQLWWMIPRPPWSAREMAMLRGSAGERERAGASEGQESNMSGEGEGAKGRRSEGAEGRRGGEAKGRRSRSRVQNKRHEARVRVQGARKADSSNILQNDGQSDGSGTAVCETPTRGSVVSVVSVSLVATLTGPR